jgi:hypothetical protein
VPKKMNQTRTSFGRRRAWATIFESGRTDPGTNLDVGKKVKAVTTGSNNLLYLINVSW